MRGCSRAFGACHEVPKQRLGDGVALVLLSLILLLFFVAGFPALLLPALEGPFYQNLGPIGTEKSASNR
jgi:hypothetical protein